MVQQLFGNHYDVNKYCKVDGLSHEDTYKLIEEEVTKCMNRVRIHSQRGLIKDVLVDTVSYCIHHYKKERGGVKSFINMICLRKLKAMKMPTKYEASKHYQCGLNNYQKTKQNNNGYKKLYKCIGMLTPKEQDIIQTVFFDRKRLKGKHIQSEYKIALKKLHNLYLEEKLDE